MKYFSSFRNEQTPTASMLKYRIGSFSSLDARDTIVPKSLGLCSYGYNIRFTNGMLTHSYGLRFAEWDTLKSGVHVSIPYLITEGEMFRRIHVFGRTDEDGNEKTELIAYSDKGRFYFCPLTEPSEQMEYFAGFTDVSENVSFINYYTGGKDTALIYTENGAYAYDGVLTRKEGVTGLIGACMHYDRVFGVKPGMADTIAFSALLDPFDFSTENGGGEISLMDEGGKILKLVSLRNSIYIFRENAVQRMTAYVDPTEYTITRIATLDKPVRPGSIASDLDRIFFVAGESVYSLSASGIKAEYEEVTPLIVSAEYAVGKIYDGTYYLACNIRKEGDEKVGDEATEGAITENDSLFGFGFARGTLDIMRGTDLRDFAAVVTDEVTAFLTCLGGNRGAALGMLTDDGTFFGLPFLKLWRSHTVKVGDEEKLKVLKRIYLNSGYQLNITVETEEGKILKSVYGGEKMSLSLWGKLCGDSLKISFSSAQPCLRVGEAVLYIAQYGRYLGNDGSY